MGARSLLCALVCACALTLTSQAAAQDDPAARWPADGPALSAARQIAVDHWAAGAPCQGSPVDVHWDTLPSTINAQSSWSYLVNVPSLFVDCSVAFNVQPLGGWTWPKLCSVMVHEYGHLLGHDHEPSGIMTAVYSGPVNECTGAEPTTAPLPAPAAPTPPPASVPVAAPASAAAPPTRKARRATCRAARANAGAPAAKARGRCAPARRGGR